MFRGNYEHVEILIDCVLRRRINERTGQLYAKRAHHMKTEQSDLLTAGAIAKQLALPDAKVKKAIADLKIKPAAKKGVCNLYSKDVVTKVKAAMK